MGYRAPRLYTLQINGYPTDFLDSTEYCLSNMYPWTPQVIAKYDVFKMYIPQSSIVRAVFLKGVTQNVAGSGENWTMNIRVNNTTNYAIATVASNNPTDGVREWINTDMNVSLSKGDYIVVDFTAPAWVTNPTQYKIWGYILLETP